ncbi:unnamed protein product [Ectocarpus sp. 12 AP-2014]
MVGKYSTTILADRAIEVATEHVEKSSPDPLFLYVAHQAAHSPLNAPPPGVFTKEEEDTLARLVADTDRRVFARIIYFLDKEVRYVVNSLSQTG